ncbi:maleylpyruvate isomerase N-terminal domain-containing protein [Nocardia sp. N2S4-5]|uniref:maleylpyruvate isomerase N-terminal domain-containing protein n=1 Tax=Nocardia sp. N2S4-5 TaxID=3351565 RepID=UPI0037CFA5FF
MIPLDTRPLFPRERRELISLLESLEPADWAKPTVCPGWAVRDITAHILNDYLRRLSGSRDGHAGAADLLRPVVVAFLHALPAALRDRPRPPGTAVLVEVTGTAGGRWAVISDGTAWDLTAAIPEAPAAVVRMDADTVWRLGSRGLTVDQARQRIQFEGDHELTISATTLLAVVA